MAITTIIEIHTLQAVMESVLHCGITNNLVTYKKVILETARK